MNFFDNPVSLAFATWLVAIGCYAIAQACRHYARKKKAADLTDNPEGLMEAALQQLQVMESVKHRNHNGHDTFIFQYHEGEFVAYIHSQGYMLTMPCIYSCHMSDLPLTRITVNHVNQECTDGHVIYNLNDEQNQIFVSAVTSLSLTKSSITLHRDLERGLHTLFGLRSSFYEKHITWMTLKNETGAEDPELHQMERTFEEMAIDRNEARSHLPKPEACATAQKKIELGPLLSKLCEGGLPPYQQLQIVAGGQISTLTDPEDIRKFDLLSPLVTRDEQGVSACKRENACLLLTCRQEGEKGATDELVTLTLQHEFSSRIAHYVRVSICRPPVPGRKMETIGDEIIYMDSLSLVLGASVNPEEKRITETDYMWHEAQDLLKAGKLQDFTEEQRFMAFYAYDHDLFQSIYWGRKLMLQNRYYEALLYLENAYDILSPEYLYMKRESRDRFHELCYRIGFCYNELKLYKEAYVYLDAVANCGNLTYVMEYINCLVNSKDHRAISVIENFMNQAENYQEDTEEAVPEQVQKFWNFLRRRKAFVLVEQEQYDAAEALLKEMLSEAANSDYALNELAYLQNRKKEDKEGETDNPEEAPR